ncbi:MAG: hypothetical protein BVN34_02545 [Proteobacteria bacterium ST_bin12]|nr:MAG: hypothetical protein BVN34_02545 [Proteobacteria bacterium ST_bin12]
MKTLFSKPIVIQLLPSYLLLGLLLVVATASCAILLSISMHLMLKLSILSLVIASSAYFIARDALLMLPWSWQSVEVDTKGVLTLVNKRQQRFKPQLTSSTFVHEYCVILNFKYAFLKWPLAPALLFNFADNAEALRRLRVWLRVHENKKFRQMQQTSTQLTITGD